MAEQYFNWGLPLAKIECQQDQGGFKASMYVWDSDLIWTALSSKETKNFFLNLEIQFNKDKLKSDLRLNQVFSFSIGFIYEKTRLDVT